MVLTGGSLFHGLAQEKGWLEFREKPCRDVMQQIADLYHKELVWKESAFKSQLLTGRIDKSRGLPRALHMIELATQAHCSVEGNRIMVSK